jgi:hypothetical protein
MLAREEERKKEGDANVGVYSYIFLPYITLN